MTPSTRLLRTVFLAAAWLLGACSPINDVNANTIIARLAQHQQNAVEVTLQLERDQAGALWLAAVFRPEPGLHLYSKDIPRAGVDGLGRPTLLELPANTSIQLMGVLTESIASMEPPFEPKDLRVYPEGPVALRLPVRLPAGASPVRETIFVTYMACNQTGCRPPVENLALVVEMPLEKSQP